MADAILHELFHSIAACSSCQDNANICLPMSTSCPLQFVHVGKRIFIKIIWKCLNHFRAQVGQCKTLR